MELIGNKAVSIKLRKESAKIILDDIEKSDVIKDEGDVITVAVYWGLDEMTRLNRIMRFKNPCPLLLLGTMTGLVYMIRLTIKELPQNFYL